MTFDEMAHYLRENSKTIEADQSSKKQIMMASADQDVTCHRSARLKTVDKKGVE